MLQLVAPSTRQDGPDLTVVPDEPRVPAPATEGLRLDDPALLAASDLVEQALARGRGGALRSLVRQPRALAAAVGTLRRLPRLELPLTASAAGRAIAERLDQREGGLRSHCLAQGVLTIPDDLDAYLQGRQRQGLRNKLNKAGRAGISTAVVDAATGELAWKEIEGRRPSSDAEAAEHDGNDWELQPGISEWLVASTPDGVAESVMCLIVDRDVALMRVFHAAHGSAASSLARHALHQATVVMLRDRGVRYFVGDSALRIPRGLRAFVHGLGYRAWNLRPSSAEG